MKRKIVFLMLTIIMIFSCYSVGLAVDEIAVVGYMEFSSNSSGFSGSAYTPPANSSMPVIRIGNEITPNDMQRILQKQIVVKSDIYVNPNNGDVVKSDMTITPYTYAKLKTEAFPL